MKFHNAKVLRLILYFGKIITLGLGKMLQSMA